jgi:hypothetical protein
MLFLGRAFHSLAKNSTSQKEQPVQNKEAIQQEQ